MTKQNTPWKVIDPETNQEKTIWESRSMAVAIFVFTKDTNGKWRVLANKRGSGCPDNVGKWVCPCGYLDYNETLKEAAIRECFEETGVLLDINRINFFNVCDSPRENMQNVTHVFYAFIDNPFDYPFSKEHNELNEVDKIEWVDINKLNNDKEWAFNHDSLIFDMFNSRVNLNSFKKFLIKSFNNYFKYEKLHF